MREREGKRDELKILSSLRESIFKNQYMHAHSARPSFLSFGRKKKRERELERIARRLKREVFLFPSVESFLFFFCKTEFFSKSSLHHLYSTLTAGAPRSQSRASSADNDEGGTAAAASSSPSSVVFLLFFLLFFPF